MSDQTRVASAAESPTVASDETAIYEGGNLIGINIKELMNNEVALRQLINAHNAGKRTQERLHSEMQGLKEERASYTLQPAISVLVAVVNVAGVILVGLGTAYLTMSPVPKGAVPVFLVGVVLTVAATVINPLLPWIIKKLRDN